MKIKVVNNNIKSSFTEFLSVKETLKTTVLIENDPLFEKEVQNIRQRYGIDSDWLDQNKTLAEQANMYDSKWSDEKTEQFFAECDEITTRLYLPENWSNSITWFISFNVFTTPERLFLEVASNRNSKEKSKIKFYAYKEKEILNNFQKGQVFILLTEKISKLKLHKLIDEEWSEISERMESLPEAPKTNILRPTIAKRISQMRDDEKLTFPQIANALSEEYAENDELAPLLCSEDYIKNLYHRWKDACSKFEMCPF